MAPLQEPYSEELLTQAKRKRTVLRRWWNWEQVPFGRCLRSIGSPFQVVGQTTEIERVCIVAERANGPSNSREQRTAVYDGLHKKTTSRPTIATNKTPLHPRYYHHYPHQFVLYSCGHFFISGLNTFSSKTHEVTVTHQIGHVLILISHYTVIIRLWSDHQRIMF